MKTRIVRALLLAAATCLAGLTLLLAAGRAAPAPQVTRGPYLQAAQPRAVSVAWYTDAVTEGLLQWRQEGGSWHGMSSAVDDARFQLWERDGTPATRELWILDFAPSPP